MNFFTKAKARYEEDKLQACIKAGDALRDLIGVNFRVAPLNEKALEAIKSQWVECTFNWDEINRAYRSIDAFKFAIWVDDTLCGVAFANTGDKNVRLRFIEGSPNPDCPLKGRRILIALETASTYGQLRGKRNLTLEPLNEKLITVYETVYGFEVVRPRKGAPYCTKGI